MVSIGSEHQLQLRDAMTPPRSAIQDRLAVGSNLRPATANASYDETNDLATQEQGGDQNPFENLCDRTVTVGQRDDLGAALAPITVENMSGPQETIRHLQDTSTLGSADSDPSSAQCLLCFETFSPDLSFAEASWCSAHPA